MENENGKFGVRSGSYSFFGWQMFALCGSTEFVTIEHRQTHLYSQGTRPVAVCRSRARSTERVCMSKKRIPSPPPLSVFWDISSGLARWRRSLCAKESVKKRAGVSTRRIDKTTRERRSIDRVPTTRSRYYFYLPFTVLWLIAESDCQVEEDQEFQTLQHRQSSVVDLVIAK